MIIFRVVYSDDSIEKIEAESFADLEKKILVRLKEIGKDATVKDFRREK